MYLSPPGFQCLNGTASHDKDLFWDWMNDKNSLPHSNQLNISHTGLNSQENRFPTMHDKKKHKLHFQQE